MAKAATAKNVKEMPPGSKRGAPVKVAAKKAVPAGAAAAKKPGAKKATPAKPAAKKTAPAAKQATAKKTAPAAKQATAKKTAPAAKQATAKKTAPAKKAALAKAVTKVALAKPAPPAKKVAPPKPEPVKKKSTVICPLSGFEVKPDKPNLSPRTIERLRLKLLEDRARHVHQADEFQAEADALANDREGGDTQFDEESGEGDTLNVERERDLLLSASARQIIDEIDRALERIKNKTYGVCVPAGRRISLERLDALPFAETCVECKARAERRR